MQSDKPIENQVSLEEFEKIKAQTEELKAKFEEVEKARTEAEATALKLKEENDKLHKDFVAAFKQPEEPPEDPIEKLKKEYVFI